jgi:hypothetical protein
MVRQNSFYQQVLSISEDYFGPAATRFVNRIATNHLDKPADKLTEKDLPELITWAQLAANIMSDNTAAIDEYVSRLRELRRSGASAKNQVTPSRAR